MLELRALESHYGRIPALKGIDLRVAEGELVALVGANGAGKTTLLRALSGVQRVSAGQVLFCGEDITRAPSDRRVRLGIAQVPEGRLVVATLSVEDNLNLGGYTRSRLERERAIEQAYTVFPALKERRHQAAGTLSGGQQQMLAIARGLMSRGDHDLPGRPERARGARRRRPRLRARNWLHRTLRGRRAAARGPAGAAGLPGIVR